MHYDPVRLHIYGDPGDGQGSREAVFEMLAGGEETGLVAAHHVNYGYATGGGTTSSAVSSVFEDQFGDGVNTRKIHTATGGAEHRIELDFQGWAGAENPDTNEPLQWGDTGDDTNLTAWDATGERPLTQMQVLVNWLRNVPIDSGTHPNAGQAELEIGEYSDNGVMERLDVVIDGPTVEFSSLQPSTYDGSITLVETADLTKPIDAALRELF